MKMTKLLTIAILLVLYSCSSGEKGNVPKVEFGIYETISVNDLPTALLDVLKKSALEPEKDTRLPIVGYILKDQSIDKQLSQSDGDVRLFKTKYTVDDEGKYLALVSVKNKPAITNSDIHKAKNKGVNVEISFNMKGARKWADLTKNNTGNLLAFVIDDGICCMPFINGEIVSGTALISGLESEEIAEKLSFSLNTGNSD